MCVIIQINVYIVELIEDSQKLCQSEVPLIMPFYWLNIVYVMFKEWTKRGKGNGKWKRWGGG